jgi:outer membrane protein assembly factor BamB
MKAGLFLGALLFLGAPPEPAKDWPTWRHDPRRSGSTPHALPGELHLEWVRELPPLKPAWPDQPKMQFDAAYEPVVAGQTLYVGSSRNDSVTAYDTRTGRERWSFTADGPVRFAPAVWEGRVYFVSDDGCLYCLSADRGSLHWKFRGGPSDRKVLGNERLISMWPARGAPVVADGVVYFAASIWPFMGTFLYALDARTGKVVWVNDGDGMTYWTQPHNADAFAGVAPQGPLALSGDRLLVPGGRSIPATYDRRTGRMLSYRLAENSKRGGYDVAVGDRVLVAGGGILDLGTGYGISEIASPAVVDGETAWYPGKTRDLLRARFPEIKYTETKDRKGQKLVRASWASSFKPETIESPRVEALIKAGSRIYVGADRKVLAFEPGVKGPVWQAEVEGRPAALVAADDRLFVSTREGRLYCFGAVKAEPVSHPWEPEPIERSRRTWPDAGGPREGYAVVWGADPARLAGLAEESAYRILAFDPEDARVESARKALAAAGLYGERISVLQGDPPSVSLPPYLASAVFAGDLDRESVTAEFLSRAYATLRPYGGRLYLPLSAGELEALIREARLEGAGVEACSVVRAGALAGAGNWTHEHADASNTRVSKDAIVRAPLGLLWFGGPSHEGILPRHGHGPQPQVLDGRLLIEGVDMLRAIDIYTGRLLWETKLPGVGKFYNNTSHQPGANSSGTNFISTREGIYVAHGRACVRLDPATGKKLGQIALPRTEGQKEPPVLGYINVSGETLVLSADPLLEEKSPPKPLLPAAGPLPRPPVERSPAMDDDPDDPDLLRKLLLLKGDKDALSSSRRLFVLDRERGEVLWSASAEWGFRHNATVIGGGRLYTIDRLSGPQLDRLKKKGEKPDHKPRLLAFDLATGKELWRSEKGVFGTWLSYSAERDLLVEAGRVARDTIYDEPKGMRVYRAADGEVSWERKDYSGPAMIQRDTILMADRACDLATGRPRARAHPLTGEPLAWSYTRNYGCNTPMASEHLLTFRSGAAGFFDLALDGGTGNFGGFRSSCTNNLVVAGGVLTAPDYTRTCTCAYQNQTSIALVPMPENEMWTFFGSLETKGAVKRLALNFGAPGDRRTEDGTLWLEYPSVGGRSPSAPVKTVPEAPETFRRHSWRVEGKGIPWVAASGVKGMTSLSVTLDPDGKKERAYTVRLHFAEPEEVGPGARIFDVALNGREVLKDFDVAREAGGPLRALVREFPGVRARNSLTVTLVPRVSETLLSGLEVAAEDAPEPVAALPPTVEVAPLPPYDPDAGEPLFYPGREAPEEPSLLERVAPWCPWAAKALGALLLVLVAVRILRRGA